MSIKQEFTNKLITEKSPYLLQHAHNPVNWYPWGEEAFEAAKRRDVPIFLSIGYSTCHWCHVMERESFEDLEVADILNEHFISIKVDREERPDVDHIYMSVCQALTGSGGWPLTIFMTPEREPFFAGTYYPKQDRMGMQGLISILKRINIAWSKNRESLMHSSKEILNAIDENNNNPVELDEGVIHTAFLQFKNSFDSVYGGFNNAPKFPTPHNLYFLLRYWHTTKDNEALEMVEKTLDSMYSGGIYDHIGFGFSRYSTDRKWLVPHFEKMLYDNALLAIIYLETYQATKNIKYAEIAKQIFTYLLRDMVSPEGGFYSAEDADSEGVEGKFYVWSYEEVIRLLGQEDGEKFAAYYHITQKGNFEGENIPNIIGTIEQPENYEFYNTCRNKLFSQREIRIHPYKDDKILTSWNGLIIAAFAIGGRILDNKEYILVAEKAVSFIYNNLIRSDGRLLARYRDGEAAIPAYVDDYSFLTWGLIELYETTYKPDYLKKANELNSELVKIFWDNENGGLFIYGNDSEQLITRPKEIYDGATPSGNSVSALNFLRLSRLTGKFELEDKALKLLKFFGQGIKNYPKAYTFSLIAFLFLQSKASEIVLVADEENTDTKEMLDIINKEFRPFTISMVFSKDRKDLEKLAPFISNYSTEKEKTTAYICENFSCQAPVTDVEVFGKILQN